MTRVVLMLTAVIGALSCVYTVDAREVAVVTFFGKPVETVIEPGLKIRAPWPLHSVTRFDKRTQLLSVEPTEVLTRDKKNLVVETFVLWKVSDPERFLEAVGTPATAETQLSDLVISRLAAALGGREFSDLMTDTETKGPMLPDDLLPGIAAIGNARLGIDVIDIQLRHIGLPLQNEQSIYERMRAERSRIAKAYRSEGEERAQSIRAEADRKAAEILANADKEAMGIRARADGTAARIYANAYAADPDFYVFMRKLQTTQTLLEPGSVLVVDSEGPLFDALTAGAK